MTPGASPRAILLALFVSALAPAARADSPASDAPQTPLALAPSKPLAFEQPPTAGIGWKLGGFVLVVALGAWVFLRRGSVPSAARVQSLNLIAKVGVGAKAEIVVVEVEGQRLVLGVTAHTITSLYVLPGDDAPEPVEEPDPRRRIPPRRASAVLADEEDDDGDDAVLPSPRRRFAALERQAQGLLSGRGRE